MFFFVDGGSVADPQGFDDQKLEKMYSSTKIYIYLIKNFKLLIQCFGSVFFTDTDPDPDPVDPDGGQYGSGYGSNPDPGL